LIDLPNLVADGISRDSERNQLKKLRLKKDLQKAATINPTGIVGKCSLLVNDLKADKVQGSRPKLKAKRDRTWSKV
jgi:hypothetical protein